MKLIEKRLFKNEEIYTLTIPKGTVLFRAMAGKDRIITDFLGVESETSSKADSTDYCLSPYHNVFFYIYPYVIDTNIHAYREGKNHMVFYHTTTELKVLLLLKPSPWIRNEKYPDPATAVCSEYQYCGVTGRPYDKCLTTEFMEANPDVAGMIGIQGADIKRFGDKWVERKFESFRKFVTFMWDAGNMKDRDNSGPVEIALYPRRIRSMVEIKTTVPDKQDLYTYVKKRIDEYNFFPFEEMPHKYFAKDRLYETLLQMFSPRGHLGRHLTIDKRTYFYMLYEETQTKDRKYLINIQEPKKLPLLQKDNPESQLCINSPFKINKLVKKLEK
jgi:hypothetical protein